MYEINDKGEVIVTTTTGYKVKCLPYGDDMMSAGSALVLPEKPNPPTYEIGEGEDAVRVPYTPDSIDDESVSAEDTELWGQYLIKLQEYKRQMQVIETQKAVMRGRVMVYRATEIVDLPDLDEWAKEREEFYGIAVSEDPKERLFQFYTSEVATGTENIVAIMTGIMRATGYAEEVLDSFEDSFRDSMGRG